MAKVELPEKTPASAAATPDRPARTRRRRGFRVLLLVFAVLALLPTGLSIFGGFPRLLRQTSPRLADAIQFRTISLHWWAPVEITDLRIQDLSERGDRAAAANIGRLAAAGTDSVTDSLPDSPSDSVSLSDPIPLLRVARLTTQEPLWQIVARLGVGTSVDLLEPDVTLVADDSGTNLQRTMTALFGDASGSSGGSFPIRVTIRNGRLSLRSVSLSQSPQTTTTQLTEIDGTFSSTDPRRPFPEVQLSAWIARPDEADPARTPSPSGALAGAQVRVAMGPSGEKQQRQSVHIAARELDLRMVQPLLQGAGIRVNLEGIVSCDLAAELAGQALSDGLAGRLQLSGSHVRFRCPEWSAGEWLGSPEIVASGAVAWARDGVLLDQLQIRSELLEASGSGEVRFAAESPGAEPAESNQARISGWIDLARLSSQLSRTLGIREGVELKSGRINFSAAAERVGHLSASDSTGDGPAGRKPARWQAALENSRLEFVRGGRPTVLETQLRVDAAGPFSARPQVSQVRMTADFGRLDAVQENDGLKIAGTISPEKLWGWLNPVLDIPRPGISGDVSLRSHVTFTGDSLQMVELQISGADLQAKSSGMQVDFRKPVSEMFRGDFQVAGSGAAFRTLAAPWHAATWLAESSTVAIDLATQDSSQLRLRAVVQPLPTDTAGNRTIRPVALRTPSALTALVVDEATADFQLTAEEPVGTVRIHSGQFTLPGMSAAVRGTVTTGTSGSPELDVTADTRYDLEVLSSRLLVGNNSVRLTGSGQDVFRITGSPTQIFPVAQENTAGLSQLNGSGPAPLRITGGFSWESADILGFHLSGAQVRAVLENGIIRTEPIRCRLNSGEVSLIPRYHLAQQRLELATGSRAEHVELSPELCRDWMGYLAPLMADASTVSGVISARVERFDYHVNTPEHSDIAAIVAIHKAEANPGPSLMPLLQAIDALRRISGSDRATVVQSLVLPPQEIPVQLTQGLVSHQGLTMDLAGYRVRSSGNVGLDRRIQLVLDIPLEKTRSGAESRTVRVPVRGTIEQPQPDTSGMIQSLGAQTIEKKLNKELENRLDKFLDKL